MQQWELLPLLSDEILHTFHALLVSHLNLLKQHQLKLQHDLYHDLWKYCKRSMEEFLGIQRWICQDVVWLLLIKLSLQIIIIMLEHYLLNSRLRYLTNIHLHLKTLIHSSLIDFQDLVLIKMSKDYVLQELNQYIPILTLLYLIKYSCRIIE